VALQQQLQKLMQLAQQLKMKVGDKHEANQVRLQATRETNASRERIAGMQIEKEHRHKLADAFMAEQSGSAERAERDQDRQTAQQNREQDMARHAQERQEDQAARQSEVESQTQERAQGQQTTQQFAAIVSATQTALEKFEQEVAELGEKIEAMGKPRNRKGKAKLPSGQEMSFEMSEA
jgi:hypothetical protein